MRWFTHTLMTFGVTAALLATPWVIAQDYRGVKPQVEMKKATVAVKQQMKVQATAKVLAPAKVANKNMAVPDNVAPAIIDPMIQQFTPQCRPLVRSEIHIVMAACNPTKEQREKIALESERILKEVVTKFADAQNRMNQGQWQGGRMADPRKLTEEKVGLAVKLILSPEQIVLYRKEVEARAAAQIQVAVQALVARLDQMLVLSTEQRRKLLETLTASWDDSWGHSLEQFLTSYDERYLPMIPDKAIVPHLNELQKKVYIGTQKLQVNFFGNFNFRGDMMIEEEILEVEIRANPPAQAIQKQAVKAVEVQK